MKAIQPSDNRDVHSHHQVRILIAKYAIVVNASLGRSDD